MEKVSSMLFFNFPSHLLQSSLNVEHKFLLFSSFLGFPHQQLELKMTVFAEEKKIDEIARRLFVHHAFFVTS
jgi:hypothetical protein